MSVFLVTNATRLRHQHAVALFLLLCIAAATKQIVASPIAVQQPDIIESLATNDDRTASQMIPTDAPTGQIPSSAPILGNQKYMSPKLYMKPDPRKRKTDRKPTSHGVDAPDGQTIDADGRPQVEWQCPNITSSRNLECGCDMPHTLRCSGDIHSLGVSLYIYLVPILIALNIILHTSQYTNRKLPMRYGIRCTMFRCSIVR